jgi:hypothetical protein
MAEEFDTTSSALLEAMSTAGRTTSIRHPALSRVVAASEYNYTHHHDHRPHAKVADSRPWTSRRPASALHTSSTFAPDYSILTGASSQTGAYQQQPYASLRSSGSALDEGWKRKVEEQRVARTNQTRTEMRERRLSIISQCTDVEMSLDTKPFDSLSSMEREELGKLLILWPVISLIRA